MERNHQRSLGRRECWGGLGTVGPGLGLGVGSASDLRKSVPNLSASGFRWEGDRDTEEWQDYLGWGRGLSPVPSSDLWGPGQRRRTPSLPPPIYSDQMSWGCSCDKVGLVLPSQSPQFGAGAEQPLVGSPLSRGPRSLALDSGHPETGEKTGGSDLNQREWPRKAHTAGGEPATTYRSWGKVESLELGVGGHLSLGLQVAKTV